eukprot:2847045-Rhodomonas_salina.6
MSKQHMLRYYGARANADSGRYLRTIQPGSGTTRVNTKTWSSRVLKTAIYPSNIVRFHCSSQYGSYSTSCSII